MKEIRGLIQSGEEPKQLPKPDTVGQTPELHETGPQQLINWIRIGNEISSSYETLNPERKKAAGNFFKFYKDYLKLRFQEHLAGKNFKNQDELDTFFQHLISSELHSFPKFEQETKGLRLTPEKMQADLTTKLTETAYQTHSARELCEVLGINYDDISAVLIGKKTPKKIPAKTPVAEEISTEQKTEKERNKLAELLPYLISHGIPANSIRVTKGSLRGKTRTGQAVRFRRIPYILVELQNMNKQVLICNHIGDAAFVSQESLSIEVIEEAEKTELEQKFGLSWIQYDTKGNWLRKIFSLLAEGKKDTTALKADILRKFPTSADFLKIIGSKEKFSLVPAQVVKTLLASTDSSSPTNAEIVLAGMEIYGKDDPNLNYALKLEKKDAEYFRGIINNGLPDGVNYFLPNVNEKTSDEVESHFKGCATEADFLKRYFPKGYHNLKFAEKLLTDLNIGSHRFVEMFAPKLHRERVAVAKEKGETFSFNALDMYEASKAIYPETNGRQFQYLIDREKPEEIINMLRGSYDLEGIYSMSNADGVFKLDPKPLSTFTDFLEKIDPTNKDDINRMAKKLNQMFGFGALHLSAKFDKQSKRTEPSRPSQYVRLLETLKQVYPESEQEIENIRIKYQAKLGNG